MSGKRLIPTPSSEPVAGGQEIDLVELASDALRRAESPDRCVEDVGAAGERTGAEQDEQPLRGAAAGRQIAKRGVRSYHR